MRTASLLATPSRHASRTCAVAALLTLLLLSLSGCRDDREVLAEACLRLEAMATRGDDCDALAAEVEDLVTTCAPILTQLKAQDAPPDAELWQQAVAPCMRGHLELSVGTCANHPRLRQALDALIP